MDGVNDWGWNATANGYYPTSDASSSSYPTNTTTALIPAPPVIPTNNSQMMNGVNYPFSNTIHHQLAMPMNNGQMMGGGGGVADWSLSQTTTDDSYRSFDTSSSSFSFSYSSSTFSANTIPMTNTVPMTNTTTPMSTIPVGTYNQQNTSFSGEVVNQHNHPMNIKNIKQMLQNSNYSVNVPKTQNHPVSNNNMSIVAHPNRGKLPKVSKYHHYPPQQQQQQNHPISNNNMSIVPHIPNRGKTPKVSKYHHYPQQQQQQLQQQNHIQINHPSIQIPEHATFLPCITTKQSKIKTKRVYKMPMVGLNSDRLQWKKYGAKLLDGSPYPRVYYKCAVTNDCKVRRKVQFNKSDPNTLIVTYCGDHNHILPPTVNFLVGSSSSSNIDFTSGQVTCNNVENNPPTFSKAISPAAILSFEKKKTRKNKNVNTNKDDDVFGGLEDFVPL